MRDSYVMTCLAPNRHMKPVCTGGLSVLTRCPIWHQSVSLVGSIFGHFPTRTAHSLSGRAHKTPQPRDYMFHLKTSSPKGKPFKLSSVLKAEPPAGTDGSDWHRYEIAHGSRTMVGYRQGSRQSVKVAIEIMVVHLNERRVGKGRVQPKNRV